MGHHHKGLDWHDGHDGAAGIAELRSSLASEQGTLHFHREGDDGTIQHAFVAFVRGAAATHVQPAAETRETIAAVAKTVLNHHDLRGALHRGDVRCAYAPRDKPERALTVTRTDVLAELLAIAKAMATAPGTAPALTPTQLALLNPRVVTSPTSADETTLTGAVCGAAENGTYTIARAGAAVTVDVAWPPYKLTVTIRW